MCLLILKYYNVIDDQNTKIIQNLNWFEMARIFDEKENVDGRKKKTEFFDSKPSCYFLTNLVGGGARWRGRRCWGRPRWWSTRTWTGTYRCTLLFAYFSCSTCKRQQTCISDGLNSSLLLQLLHLLLHECLRGSRQVVVGGNFVWVLTRHFGWKQNLLFFLYCFQLFI